MAAALLDHHAAGRVRYFDWQLDDPAGKPVEQVRPIRDEIDTRVRELLGELVPGR